MENVQSKLTGASNTYKTKKKGLRRTLEKVIEYQERSKCKPLLESCRTEVKDALSSLPVSERSSSSWLCVILMIDWLLLQDQWNHEIPTGTGIPPCCLRGGGLLTLSSNSYVWDDQKLTTEDFMVPHLAQTLHSLEPPPL